MTATTDVTPQTQEVRIATTITGGVSLAVWMGGVVRELDLLARASVQRRNGVPSPAATPAEATLPLYRALIDFLDVVIDVDMISGTSAGGINGVFLALARARGCDLGDMRSMWLELGSFLDLLRDPGDKSVPSLLYGDQWMYKNLVDRLSRIAGTADPAQADASREARLHVTTTLLSGEEDAFTDAIGTRVPNTDHAGVFTFTRDQLQAPGAVSALALTARSTASFPGAFEPSFVPIGSGTDPVGTIPGRPDMAPFANFGRSHWVSDGGVLNNMPLGLVLDDIFARPSSTDVRRVLLYVVPTTTPSVGQGPATPDDAAKPYGFVDGLLKNVSALTKQSAKRDLAAIRDHNARVRARRDARLQLVDLAERAGGRLLTSELLCAYLQRSDEHVAQQLVDALLSAPPPTPAAAAAQFEPAVAASEEERFRSSLVDQAQQRLADTAAGDPLRLVPPDDPGRFGAYGQRALGGAKAIALSVLRAEFALADGDEARQAILDSIERVHRAAGTALDRADLRALAARVRAATDDLGTALQHLVAEYDAAVAVRADSWTALTEAFDIPALRLRAAPAAPTAMPAEGCAPAAGTPEALDRMVRYLFGGADPLAVRLFDLSITERALLPADDDTDQLVELVQTSADTRCSLAPQRALAQQKLTGLQLRNFGAFYKRSWRANDWMWGRLDGAGWLVHLLLSAPRLRERAVRAGIASGGRAAWTADRLATIAGLAVAPQQLVADLAWLEDDSALPPPDLLAGVALWLARAWQLRVAEGELPLLATAVGLDESPESSREWAAAVLAPGPRDLGALLASCPVPDETFTTDRSTALMLKTVTKAAATATAAASGVPALQRAAKPVLATGTVVTRGAYIAVRGLKGRGWAVAVLGLVLTAFGAVAAAQQATWIGLTGLTITLLGLYLLVLAAWQRGLRTLVALIAVTVAVLIYAVTTEVGRTQLFGAAKHPGALVQAVYWAGAEWWHPLILLAGFVLAAFLAALALFRPPRPR